MNPEKIIAGKWVLIVEDEKDVIEVLTELLEACRLDAATSFEQGKRLLNEND
jgi:CheY-like chemotaxis protein